MMRATRFYKSQYQQKHTKIPPQKIASGDPFPSGINRLRKRIQQHKLSLSLIIIDTINNSQENNERQDMGVERFDTFQRVNGFSSQPGLPEEREENGKLKAMEMESCYCIHILLGSGNSESEILLNMQMDSRL